MTDEQIFELAEKIGFQDDFSRWNFTSENLLDFVFMVQKAEQEKPWVKSYGGGKPNYCTPDVDAVNMSQERVDETAKGEHKREWVGLDEVEVTGMTCECVDDGTFNMSCAHDFARAIEAKLREKNT